MEYVESILAEEILQTLINIVTRTKKKFCKHELR